MRTAALIGAAGLLAYGAWLWSRQDPAQAVADDEGSEWIDEGGEWFDEAKSTGSEVLLTAEDVLTTASETTAEFVDSITGGILKVSAMSRVNHADLFHPNVQAMLAVIRAGEGTAGPNGYRTLFGGALFDSYTDHPRITVRKSGYTSTAAGAYQFLASTWDETKRIMGLPDFSPRSQDLGALGRIAARGALQLLKQGQFEAAIQRLGREWASLPGSPYGQPVMTWHKARTIYASAGGDTITA